VSFDRVAPWYRALETIAFGHDLQRCRVACLNEITSPHRALIVGEGNGRFLCELLRAHPEVEVVCVDASERMLALARKRLERCGPEATSRVQFLPRDIRSWTPPVTSCDLIVTHFFLDCFPVDQLAAIVGKLSSAATTDAVWLLADFRVPTKGFARLRARAWLATMYRFFRFVARIDASDLVNPSPFLRAEGWTRTRQHLFRNGILKSERWRKQ
jgi:ubiquinone/menaquinone biosynthesis C-methylase UbiE